MALTLAENDFDFYLRFAKPLVLNLSEPNDKALAAAWIQKLRDENVGDLRLRTDYLKLLLFVLQRNKLIGTFAGNPNAFEKLNEFPETQLKDVAKELLESEEELRKEKQREGGDFPPYATEHSADLLEYAAAQEIPNFGVQAYYAISNDPLPLWNRTENAVFPRGAFSATDQTARSQQRQVVETSSEPTIPHKKVQFKFESKTKMKTPTRYTSFQSQLPNPCSSYTGEPCEEERRPLTWGSNLIGVTDPTPHEYVPVDINDEDSDVVIISNRPYYNSEDQINGDFTDGSQTMHLPYICKESQGSLRANAITPLDFEPFDTMLENYDREEALPSTSFTDIPSYSVNTSRLPVAKASRIPHVKSSRRKAPSSNLTKTSRPRTSKETRLDEVDLFHLETQQTLAYSPPLLEDFEDFSLPLQTPSPQKPKPFTGTPRRQLFSPTLLQEEVKSFFLETPPSFIDDSNLLSIESLEDASIPLKTPSPQRHQTLPKEQERYLHTPEYAQEQIFLETPPSFVNDSSLSSIEALEEPSLPLKTPSPQKLITTPKRALHSSRLYDFEVSPVDTFDNTSLPIRTSPRTKTENVQDFSLESLPYLTPAPRRYGDYSLPLKTPTSQNQQIPLREITAEDLSLPSLPYFTPTPRRLGDVNVSLRTPTPKRTHESSRILEQYLYSPELPKEEADLLFLESSPSFINDSTLQSIDILEEESLQLQTPPRQKSPRHIEDVSLPLKTLTPKRVKSENLQLSSRISQLHSPRLPKEKTKTLDLEKPLSLYEDYNEDPLDTLVDISFPLRTPSPRGYTDRPDLLETLGLSTDQMQIEFHDTSSSKRRESDELNVPLVNSNSPAAQDIIEEFNEQNILQNNVLSSKSQLEVNRLKPRRGIPRRVVSIDSSTQIPLFKKKEQYQPRVRQLQSDVNQPRRSRIARLKSRPVLDKKDRVKPESSKRFLEKLDTQLQSTLDENQAYLIETAKQKSPRRSPTQTTAFSGRSNLDNIESVISIESFQQASPNKIQSPDMESEPKTPSPRRPRTRHMKDNNLVPFAIDTNDSFLELQLESPPQEYESLELPMSPNESFGLPRAIKIADLPPIIHSPYQALSPTIRSFEEVDQLQPIPSGPRERQVSNRISEFTTDSLSAKVAKQIENMLKELEEPFEQKWTFPKIPEQTHEVLEESFEFPESPEAVSPIREFTFLSRENLEKEIDNILAQTPLTIAPSPQRTPKKTSNLFECTDNTSYDGLYTETPPRMGYESPKTPPGYQSPSAFFKQTPPEGFQFPEFIESPTLVSERPQHTGPDQILLNPDSPVESPRTLRNRLRQIPYSEYGERNRILVAPKVPPLKELPDNYQEEDISFLENVQSSKSQWKNKKKRKIQIPETSLEGVLESPIKIPTMFEVEDTTGIRPYREELEKRYHDLLIPEEAPIISQPVYSSYQRDAPLLLWDTPPQYKFKPVQMPPKMEIGGPLSPSKPDDLIEEEEFPPHILFSPEYIPPEELQVIQLTKKISDMIDQDIARASEKRPKPLENITDEESFIDVVQSPTSLNIEAEEFPSDIMQSPPPLSPELKTPPPRKPIRRSKTTSTSPFRVATPRRPSPKSPYSPAESPIALRIRMFQADEPPYYSQPQMQIMTGKTKGKKIIVKRGLETPKHYTLREETEGYSDEHTPFRSQVESSTRKFIKPRKKIKMSKRIMEDIRESPIRVPHVTEVEDPTGFRIERERIEQSLSDLPEIDYQYPEELFGTAADLPEQQRSVTILDTTPPKNLPKPMKPKADFPGWKTPPQYKYIPHKVKRRLPFLESVELYEDVLSEELIPASALYSPPQISPTDRERFKASIITPKQPTKLRQFTSPQQSPSKLKEHEKSLLFPPRSFETIELSQNEILDDELIPDDMETLSPIRRTPPRVQPALLSPISSPESPINLHLRLIQGGEPPYYSKPSMNVMVGTGKKVTVKRRSRPSKIQKVREIPEDFPEEQLPFLTQVETAGKLPPKRRKRIQQTSQMESVRELPMTVPYWLEMDDVTGFRKIREAIEARCADLPDLPTVYPEDLLGTTITDRWEQDLTQLDTNLPENLPVPLQPTSEVPGWKTPPNLKITKKPTQSSKDFQFTFQPELFYEMMPSEMAHGLPPQSPKTPKITKQQTFKRPISKVTSPLKENISLLTFEQLEKKAAIEPEILDLETLSEDYLQYESPVRSKPPQKIPRRPVKPFKSKTLSFVDKYLARESTRTAYKQLMDEEDGTLPPSSKSAVHISVSSRKLKSSEPKIEESLNKSLEDFETLEKMYASDSPKTSSGVKSHDVHSHVQLLDAMDRIGKQVKELQRKPTYYERIEDLIYDVPDPHIPMPPPRTAPVLAELKSPPWSPKLPTTSEYFDSIDADYISEEILNYQSPKTPSPKKATPKATTPKQTSPKHISTESKQYSPKPVARNLFDEFDETEELLDDANFPDEQLISSPYAPETPPTPPRIEDFYDIRSSPKTPKSPNLTEKLKQHRYTLHRYDTHRDMMTKTLQIKNKRVPVRKSRHPKVFTIQESREEGTNIPPRTTIIREEIIEVKPIPSVLPEFTPITLEFDSPVKIEKVKVPPKYVYTEPRYSEELYSVSPPKYFLYTDPILEYDEIVEFPEFPPEEDIPQFIIEPQVSDYVLPRPSYFGSPGREYIRTPVRHRPYYDFDDASDRSVRSNQQAEPTSKVHQFSDFSLPKPVYFGSPGREYIRTPYVNRQYRAPRIAESITVTEFGEPFEDFNLRYNILDTSPIQVVEDDSAAGYQ